MLLTSLILRWLSVHLASYATIIKRTSFLTFKFLFLKCFKYNRQELKQVQINYILGQADHSFTTYGDKKEFDRRSKPTLTLTFHSERIRENFTQLRGSRKNGKSEGLFGKFSSVKEVLAVPHSKGLRI